MKRQIETMYPATRSAYPAQSMQSNPKLGLEESYVKILFSVSILRLHVN